MERATTGHRRRGPACLAALATLLLICTAGTSSATGSLPSPGTARQIASLVSKSHLITKLPSGLVPSLNNLNEDSFGYDYPSTSPYGCLTTSQCVFADIKSSKTVILDGDSHAAMWLPALIPSVTAAKERLVVLWYPYCPTANVEVWNPLTKSPNTQCGVYRTKFADMIRALDPTLVLLADRTSGNRNYADKPISNATWKSGEIQTIKSLRTSSTLVAVIGDVSIFSSNVATCLAANPSGVQKCAVSNPNPKTDQHFSSERAAAAAQKISYINPEPWLCAKTCSPVVGNFVVFYDEFHVTVTYAAVLSGVFGKALRGVH
jgi:hypothetical protein